MFCSKNNINSKFYIIVLNNEAIVLESFIEPWNKNPIKDQWLKPSSQGDKKERPKERPKDAQTERAQIEGESFIHIFSMMDTYFF